MPAGTKDSQLTEGWLAQEKDFIETFFEKKVPQALSETEPHVGEQRPTAESCDKFAKTLLGSDDIRPVDNQGAQSYTLICPSQNTIVQFRLRRFDEDALALAHKIYGELVPAPTLKNGFPIPVYVCPVMPGVLHIFQDFPKGLNKFPLDRQLNTVHDLAIFVAKAAFWPQPKESLTDDSWTVMARAKLTRLTQMTKLYQIEPRFARRASYLLSRLHLLEKLPLTLNHLDFAEINIMVDRESGHLTGVLDFDDARTEAFGMCIFGVYEGFFGVMRDARWRFFDEPVTGQSAGVPDRKSQTIRQVLEAAFWNSFWDAVPSWIKKSEYEDPVTVALDVGIINRYFDKDCDVDPDSEDDMRAVNWATGLLLDR